MQFKSDAQRKAVHANKGKRKSTIHASDVHGNKTKQKMKGFGYFVEYKHAKKDGQLGKKHVTKSFHSLNNAVREAKKHQDGNSVVRVIDATNIINHKEVASIDLHHRIRKA